MSKVVAALGRLETWERCADRGPQDLARATARLPQDRFQLRKGMLDRIEVGTVFRQKPETGPAVLNRSADRRTLVTRQVVHDDDIAGGQRRDEDLLDVSEEARAVDRAIEDGGRGEARHAERGEKRRRMPAAIGRVVGDARTVEPPPIATHEIRAHATFIEKHEPRRVERRGGGVPGSAGERDVSAIVFGRAYRFF